MNRTIQPLTLFRWKTISPLYRAAFPKAERFPSFQIWYWLARHWADGLVFYENGVFQGFSMMIVLEKTIFLSYLAVCPETRGKGVGSAILSEVRSRFPGRRIFLYAEEPDPAAPNAGQRRDRIAFYLRNGFFDTGVPYEMRSVRYVILSTDPNFSQADLDDFWDSLE